MAVNRLSGALIGTNDTTLQSIAASTTFSGSIVDILGDDLSAGEIRLFAVVTALAVSTVEFFVENQPSAATDYQRSFSDFTLDTINGTVRRELGLMTVNRYTRIKVKNNDAVNAVSAYVGYVATKVS